MMYQPIYFDLKELVCKDVFDHYGEIAWQFFDEKLLRTIDIIRVKTGRAIYINNWDSGGVISESGLRCLKCSQNQAAIKSSEMYMSAHTRGCAADFTILGMLAEESRQWIIKNQILLPYPIRLEAGVNWVHLDTVYIGKGKVVMFNP
jgi:hypothetical protein